ncbi:Hypothetical protein GSB_154713 [Giardia duodenalis]|uniref:Major capsid protein n=1 Tax=Giardia intestinalis TaxID=5741 RepID=V6TP68_GIAIN|nr:Hypothetical protein GSB_154713 [Giardia intestinalis]
MEPFVQSTTLNEELKNPHLVETLLRVAPSTGKRIQNADTNQLLTVLQEKLSGQIPEYDVNFNVQGIPLVLSKQSHLELRLTPTFVQPLEITRKWSNTPMTFEYNRSLWPKVNAACIAQASATFSNFSVESPIPALMPYLRYFQMHDDLRTNYSRAWNPSYIKEGDGDSFYYANRYVTSTTTGAFTQPIHRSPYEVAALKDEGNNDNYNWYGQPLLIQIPLEDILSVFQVPVLPLRQTNTSNINIRLRLRSPRHMFFSAGYFNPSSASAFINAGVQNTPSEIKGLKTVVTQNLVTTHTKDFDIENVVMGGGTLAWLKALTSYPFAQYGAIESFYVDFDVDCELVLHCLTTPLLNPLAQRYIEPFIDEQNQFVAHFTDYYTYSQTLNTNLLVNNRFSFTPSQLFYNTTHVALFFMQDINPVLGNIFLPESLSQPLKVGMLGSLFNHAHFVIRENVDIKQFNILLGSSCTPLFDQPLTMADMMVATEEAMKKYNPLEMYGDLLFLQNRFQEGDAFFFFDLTHARNSGFFIDADNMMRVEGVITQRQPLKQGDLQYQAQTQQTSTNSKAAIYGTPPQQRKNIYDTKPLIHVILMLLYQNTFTVLLDLDGAVLFQQQ